MMIRELSAILLMDARSEQAEGSGVNSLDV
jgi:hypothetical protein